MFPLYRGQGGQAGDGEEGSGHLVGKFKVYLGEEWETDKGQAFIQAERWLSS